MAETTTIAFFYVYFLQAVQDSPGIGCISVPKIWGKCKNCKEKIWGFCGNCAKKICEIDFF